jgi:tetratricopeptide (TPR) repeat protein
VIDFGVAAALGEVDGRLKGLEHSAQDVIGTLGYLSPEVLSGGIGQAIVQSDVFALGIVAFELFCGRHPSLAQQVGAVAQRPAGPDFWGGDPPREFAPELHWLLAKALAPQPAERYQSMSAFATDLEALLSGRRLSVAPTTWSYRLRHFARYQPWQTAGVLLAAGSLLAGGSALGVGYLSALKAVTRETSAFAAEREALRRSKASAAALLVAKQQAEGLAQARRSVGDFFVGMFSSLSPYASGNEVRVRDLLEQNFARLVQSPPEDEGALALLHYAHGLGFQGLDDLDRAEAALRQAEALWAHGPRLADDAEQRANLPIQLALIAAQRGQQARALDLLDLGIEQLTQLGAPRPLALAYAARARLAVGWERWEDALSDLEQALALRRSEQQVPLVVESQERQQHLVLLELERLAVLEHLGRCTPRELLEAAQAQLSDQEVWGALETGWRLPLAAVSGRVAAAAAELDQPTDAQQWAVREVEVRLAGQNPRTLEVALAAEGALAWAMKNEDNAQIVRQRAHLALTLEGFQPDWPLSLVPTLLRACRFGSSTEQSLAVIDIGRVLLPIWEQSLPPEHRARLQVGRDLGLVYQAQKQWAAAEAAYAGLWPALAAPDQWKARAVIGLRRAYCLAELLRLEESLALFDEFCRPWPEELGAFGSIDQLEYQLVHARVLLGLGQLERSYLLASQGDETIRAAVAVARRPVVRYQRLGEDFRQLLGRIEQQQH